MLENVFTACAAAAMQPGWWCAYQRQTPAACIGPALIPPRLSCGLARAAVGHALWDRSTQWVQKAHHAHGHRPSTTPRPKVGCYQMEMPRRPMSLCIWVPTETGSSVVAEEPDHDDAASHTYQMQLTVALALSDPLIVGHGRAG
jgi:hypothetical protein